MDINSILNTIKNSIATDMSSEVEISEKSFISEFLVAGNETVDEDTDVSLGIFPLWRYNTKLRFPLVSAVFCFFWSLVMCVVTVFYWLVSKLMWLLTGRRRDMRRSVRFNAAIFVLVIIFYIVTAIGILAFFVKSVLLFPPTNDVNQQGAIIMKQPCGREQSVFLFNTAVCWAKTGLQVMEGDRIDITASGSYYSSVGDLCDAARENTKPLYLHSSVDEKPQGDAPDRVTRICMYSEKDAMFGSMLFQIQPDNTACKSSSEGCDDIVQMPLKHESINFTRTIIAHQTGTLYVAINDIYLTTAVCDSIRKNKQLQESLLDGMPVDLFLKKAKQSPQMWFDDNIGEMLLNISITRNYIVDNAAFTAPGAYSLFSKFYRSLESIKQSGNLLYCFLLFVAVVAVLLYFDFIIARVIRLRHKAMGS